LAVFICSGPVVADARRIGLVCLRLLSCPAAAPVPTSVFSAGFALALCPFVCTSLLAVLRVREFLDGGVFDSPHYTVGRLQGPVSFAIAGAWVSAAALLAYSIAYGVTSKARNA